MAARTSSQSGPWDDAATWGGNPFPVSGDTVTVASGHAVTIGDGVDAVCGDSPGSAGVVLQINGTGSLTVGGGTSGSLAVKGSVDMAGGTQVVTINAGATFKLDGSGNVGQVYTFSLPYQAALILNGSSGSARATFTSETSGGASNGRIIPKAGGFRGGRIESTWGAFSNLGASGSAGLTTDFAAGLVSSADWKCLLTDTTVTGCGVFSLNSGASTTGARFEFTRVTFTNSLGTMSVQGVVDSSASTYSFVNCSFDKAADFATNTGLTFTDNYCHAGISGSGTQSWTEFSGNFVRLLTDGVGGQSYTIRGDAVGNYWFGDGAILNWHGIGVGDGPAVDQDVLIDANVFEAPDGDTAGDLIMPGAPSGGDSRTLTVTRNLLVPNGDGDAVGKLVSPIASGTYKLVVEHNTVTSTGAGETGLGTYGETWGGRADLYSSVRANVAYTPSGRSAGMIFSRTNTNTVSDAVLDSGGSVLLNHNAGNNLISATGGSVRDVYGPGYCDTGPSGGVAMFTSTTGIGTGDVIADPAFVDPLRNLGKWGQAQHATDGSVAAALAVLRDDPTEIAALLSYVREGFRPTNAAYKATYAGDAMTLDANGNAIDDTIGAMAWVQGLSPGGTYYHFLLAGGA